jgi:hypothetical protein
LYASLLVAVDLEKADIIFSIASVAKFGHFRLVIASERERERRERCAEKC